jgi:hypothetical protein
MSGTFEIHEGCTTFISDEGQRRYTAEQRDMNRDQQRAEILTFAAAGSVVSIAALIIKHILGA